jgi:hypothetical protein
MAKLVVVHPIPPPRGLSFAEVGFHLSTTQRIELDDGTVFYGFLGDLGPFETFPAWRKAGIDIELHAVREGRGMSGLEAVQRIEDTLRREGQPAKPLTCPMTINLILNGRRVVTSFQEC